MSVTSNQSIPASDEKPTFGTEFKRVIRQPAFLVTAVFLLLSAVGLNFATNWMQLTFRKSPVPLRKDLTSIPENLGPWKLAARSETLDHELQDALGTDKFIFRDFVDSRIVGKSEIDQFKNATYGEARTMMGKIQQKKSEAVVNAAVTYYTGLVDTVAHIPDRCYIADGFNPATKELKTWMVNGKPVQVRYIVFEDETHAGRVPRIVVYFFKVNGREFTGDPLEVRSSLMSLTERYGYYSKVELMMLLPTSIRDQASTDAAEKAMIDFLSNALPEIEKCWPDWEAVKSQGTAPKAQASITGGAERK